MKWFDDPYLEHASHRRRVLQMCMYAVHLASGSTLFCRRITAGTIQTYILNVATFLMRFDSCRLDPRKTEEGDRLHPMLKSIYAELERWEKVPNRREPFTLEMLEAMYDESVFGKHAFTSKWESHKDWFNVCVRGGCRLTEWAQDSSHSDVADPILDIFGDTKAFCLNDFEFEADDRTRLQGAAILGWSVTSLRKCDVTFRTQKNGAHGEKRLFTRSTKRSFIESMYRIIQRFVQLRGASDTTTPLSIYLDEKTGEVKLITSKDIETIMRKLAAHVYKITKESDLQRWSAHSLRVGACVILHAMGFTGAQIKFLLRWRSDAFLVYLRNIAVLADQQNDAIDKLLAMPDIL